MVGFAEEAAKRKDSTALYQPLTSDIVGKKCTVNSPVNLTSSTE